MRPLVCNVFAANLRFEFIWLVTPTAASSALTIPSTRSVIRRASSAVSSIKVSSFSCCRVSLPVSRSGLDAGVQHVDATEPGDRAAMADGVQLGRFALAVVECTAEAIRLGAAETVAGTPEIGRARLIRDVAQHAGHLAFLNFPERLAAELEVVALLVDRETPVAHDQDAAIDPGRELLERRGPGARFQ